MKKVQEKKGDHPLFGVREITLNQVMEKREVSKAHVQETMKDTAWLEPRAHEGNKTPKLAASPPAKGSEVRLGTYNTTTLCVRLTA